ncbi:helix-turn-helix transcriptional regulator [Tengunoibacter tsumagoiensis]|uniref:HTH luxR-type domain-containing protein n=1 Tax=Tengunoibacter tsumagoiensis TaxID=2014871 RepID=A0A401ZUC0_9CHLR|nr:hybrid sensor histidine kinase/response regulator transcription factor [Tengunoibacter tsumagoiensis]GCE10548.1 hypothetical protein KTT_04070 [Tengunoibacter tsumagoiensis]
MYTSNSQVNGPAYEQYRSLPEVMYSLSSLSNLYALGLGCNADMEAQELRYSILSQIQRTVRAQSACLFLYYAAQQRLVTAVTQGEKLTSSLLVNLINGLEMEQLALRGPGETITSIKLNEQHVLLVTLSYNGTLQGLVALAIEEGATLQDERSLLLTYMGNVAGALLYNYELRERERSAAIEQERKRIGRDLHDGILQNLSYALHKLEFIQRLLEQRQPQLAMTEVPRTAAIVDGTLRDLRYTLSSLLPPQLEQQSFQQAVQALFQDYLTYHPQINLHVDLSAFQKIPAHLEAPIFRIFQEGLTNISKHAQATEIEITLSVQVTNLMIELRDNGRGFSLSEEGSEAIAEDHSIHSGIQSNHEQLQDEEKKIHFGIQSMRERVQEAGGTMELLSQVGVGTRIRAQFPLLNNLSELTPREQDVLRLVVSGLSNRDIAQRLEISHDTVKTHIHHIIQKLRVKDRTQAAVIAARHGWF